MAVEVNRRPLVDTGVPADHVDTRVLGRVLDPADRRQQLHVEPMRPQLIADHIGAGLVVLAWWVDGGDTNQP